MKFSLPALAIRRPVTVIMLLVTVLGVGVIAFRRTPVEFMPPMDFPFLGVFIPYPGATPEQVEQEIALEAEGEFQTIRGLKELFSHSSDGGCFIGLNFDWGVDMPTAQADVRDRMERLRLVLPDDADKIFVQNFSLDTMPVLAFGLVKEGDADIFADQIEEIVVKRINRIEGVAEVQVRGYDKKKINIEIDQQALLNYNLSIFELINTLTVANVDVGVGDLLQGNKRYNVRALSEVQTIPEYSNLKLADGVRIADVAVGTYKADDPDYHFSVDGKKQFFLTITKESGANATATCDAVLAELESLKQLPELKSMEHFMYFNQGDVVSGALGGLQRAALYGGLMALLVLFAFLQRIRPTLIVAMAIPGSLVVAFVVMFASGMSLNLVTMMSMIIAVGMVVDNSIVVIENIYRHRELGLSAVESAEKGANEVSLAIVAATATTAVVFVPVFYMDSGQMSVFTRQFSVPVTVSLVASLVLALTIIPLAVSRFKPYSNSPLARLRRRMGHLPEDGSANETIHKPGRFRPLIWMRESYVWLLRQTIRHRIVAVLLLAGFIAFTIKVPASKLQFQAIPESDNRKVIVEAEFDANYSLAMAEDVFSNMEKAIRERQESLGITHVYKFYTARGGDFELYLLNEKDGVPYPYTTEEVRDILWERLPKQTPGAEFHVAVEGQGEGRGGGQSKVSVRLEGDDIGSLIQYTQRFMDLLEDFPEITDVRQSTQRAEQEIQLKIDGSLADAAGLDPTQIAQTVSFALLGAPLTESKQGGREIEVWARLRAEDRKNSANLDSVMMRGETGAMLSLEQLVTKQRGETPQTIQRRNGKNFIWVTGVAANKDMKRARQVVQQAIDQFELPLGYTVAFGDELLSVEEDQNNFLSLLLLAVILIFVVMSALFESCLLPLSILTSVPLAFLGVIWMMVLTGTAMDTVAFIGCILMVGVVVNNGIVIVDHINNLRKKEGLDRFEAVLQGGRDRLRPVLMTAITTILGSLPLIAPLVFPNFGEQAVVSLGCAMIGGLITGTFLTLLVVPLIYTFIDDLQNWLGRYFAAILGLRGGKSTAGASAQP